MKFVKKQILEKYSFTELVYERINKKLSLNLSKKEIENLVLEILQRTDEKFYEKIWKNFYVSNYNKNIKLTINSNTFRIITASKIEK